MTPSPEGIESSAAAASKGGLPPVHLWDPPFCGDLDIRIAADGTWQYLGTPIGRPALVRLFAGILKREGDRHYLVTPVEKVGITVEDAPFVAVDCDSAPGPDGGALTLTTNIGDRVTAGPDHAITVTHDASGTPRPYLHVRRGLMALIDRKTFYRLVDAGTEGRHDGGRWFGLRSAGAFFPILPMEQMP